MAGYTRNDTANNIADGNIINASDLDGEFDAVQSAFNASTGHTHDGTSGEGAPIEQVGPVQDLVITASEVKPKTTNTLDLGTSLLQYKNLYVDGSAFIDGLGESMLVDGSSSIQFRDSALAINSSTDGQLDIIADTQLEITTPTVEFNTDGQILAFGADGEVTLTHVADTGLLINTNAQLQFRDSALAINSSADGQLDIIADTKLEITSPTVELNTDGQVLAFGADGDVTLTHVADTALTLNDGIALRFRDSALKINSSADGQLDIDADTELELTAPIVDINASTSVNISNDLNLDSDSAILSLGADSEVTLTHLHNVGTELKVVNATTSSVTDILDLQVESSGTPAVGIGTGLTFSTETASGNVEVGGAVRSIATGLTPTAEEIDLVFYSMRNGSLTEAFRYDSDGDTFDVTGSINADNLDVDNININGNAITSTDTDGNIAITPNGTGEVDISKVDIDGGTIDGVTIGGASAGAGTFTTITGSGDMDIDSGTLFVDASENRVGIGTSSPGSALDVRGEFNSIVSGSANTPTFEAYRDAAGQVTIRADFARGTLASPASVNTADKLAQWQIRGHDGTAFRTAANLESHCTATPSGSQVQGDFRFLTNAGGGIVERMRIDSDGSCRWTPDGTNADMTLTASGNLLVGKTSVNYLTQGFEATPSSSFQANAMTGDGKEAVLLARLNSDGNIIEFRKDSAPVGSIKAEDGDIVVGNDTSGLKFRDTDFIPRDMDDTTSDGKVTLGSSGSRFKDLYLSGGVYLGGTGAANHLDDYEEGLHVCTIGTGSGTITLDSSTNTLAYEKIGNFCHVHGQLDVASVSSPNGVMTISLPFVGATISEAGDRSAVAIFITNPTSIYPTEFYGQAVQTQSAVSVYSGTSFGNSANQIQSSSYINISVMYRTV